jgi:drug/metabolite transporter (DMT)-like permease
VGGSPDADDVALAVVAGLLNVGALGCLYRGLAIGKIGVVAPLAAVIGAVIPVAWALITGERPTAVAMIGVVLAITAGGLISRAPDESELEAGRRSLLMAVAAGTGFGLSFICYIATSDESGMWPVLTARVAAVVGVLLAGVIVRPSVEVPRLAGAQAIVAGVLDVVAAALLLVAARTGLAATVAPVAALGPGFTVGHARWYLHERSSRAQVAGLALALLGLVLITTGSGGG